MSLDSWLAATSKAAQSVLDEYGPCVECKVETCNTDDGDFICEGCLDEARAQQRSDDRHNDPRRGQARGFR